MVIDKIKKIYPSLSKKHSAIARYVCDNLYDVVFMNAPKIAKNAGVGESTLTRFVYTLGYPSFTEFHEDLCKEVQESSLNNPFRQEHLEHNIESPVKKVFDMEKHLMDETINSLSIDVFNKCVDKIVNADQVLIVGCLNNSFIVDYFANFLSLFHSNVKVLKSLSLPFLGILESITDKTAALAFSYPRYPLETQKIVESLASRNIPIIGFTDSMFSPIIRFCTHYMITPHRYFILVDPNASIMALLHAMLLAIYQKNEDKIKENLKIYERSILSTDMFVYKDYNFTKPLE